MYVNSVRVLPAITPESSTGIPPLIAIPVMATGTKCSVFRPGEDAAANQRESIGRKNGEAYAGGRTEFRRALIDSHPRLRVTASTPHSLARVKPGTGPSCSLYVGLF